MYMENQYIQFFKTKDRFEIIALLSSGCVVNGYEPDERGIFYFRFEDKDKCEKILNQLLSKKLKIYAHEMINAIRDVQSIFNNKSKT